MAPTVKGYKSFLWQLLGLPRLYFCDRREVRKILVIQLAHLGDVIWTGYLVSALKDYYKDCAIDIVCGSWGEPICALMPVLNEVIVYDSSVYSRSGINLSSKIPDYVRKPSRYDLVINLSSDPAMDRLAVSSSRYLHLAWVGFMQRLRRSKYDQSNHIVSKYVNIVRALGAKAPSLKSCISISKESSARAERFLIDRGVHADSIRNGTIYTVHPGAYYALRIWPIERVRDVILTIQKEVPNASCVLVCGSGERPLLDQLQGVTRDGDAILYSELSIDELAALFKLSRFVLCNDSMPLHLAQAVGTPVVGIYGPASPVRCGPLLSNSIAHYLDLACSPCLDKCIFDEAKCMNGVSVEDVVSSALTMLAKKKT